MLKPKFEVIIYWSEEDQAFIAQVPELPGCATDGKTQLDALRNVEGVIQEWLQTARELARPIPKPKGRAGGPSFREVAERVGLCLTGGSLAYTLS